MRRPDRTFDPFSESPVDGVIAAHCSVKVLHFLIFLCSIRLFFSPHFLMFCGNKFTWLMGHGSYGGFRAELTIRLLILIK